MNKNYIALIVLSGLLLIALAFSQAKAEKQLQEESRVIAKIEEPKTTNYIPILPNEEPKAEQSIEEMIDEIAGMYNICPQLITAVIEYESDFDADAVSECGAVGLMQIVPKWHQDRMERLGVTDLTDAYSNILVGTDILAELFEDYGDDVYLVLMCYNEGRNGTAVQRATAGEFSGYAIRIVERSEELERLEEQK